MQKYLVYFAFAAAFATAAPLENTSPVEGSVLEKRITHSGKATWFEPNQGHCGKWNNRNDLIVAISTPMYYESDHCDQYIKIKANGKTVYAKVRDSCPPCKKYDIDLSPAAFKKLGISLDKGVQKVQWNFMNKKWRPRDLSDIEPESESELDRLD
ncbi:hypothetical protein RhiJN_14013 [Ceratobasidium sp. AG-Ba]|nr:hypothetical protein RhiJN_14013 [Ceratobasidium sp. AG-Ba]QRW14566.1 hypothetical protein RhiLY_13565 [Ceratobasidium sp. AG-Ba]